MTQQEKLAALEEQLKQLKSEIYQELRRNSYKLPSQPKARMARIHHLARAFLLFQREQPTAAESYLKRTVSKPNGH